MAELRRGIDQLDLERTLADYEVDVEQIHAALDTDRVEDAKAAIASVLRALRTISEAGFPIGAEADLADLVGFTDES